MIFLEHFKGQCAKMQCFASAEISLRALDEMKKGRMPQNTGRVGDQMIAVISCPLSHAS